MSPTLPDRHINPQRDFGCPALFPVAVIMTMTKTMWGGKGWLLLHLYIVVHRGKSVMELKARRTRRQKLKQRREEVLLTGLLRLLFSHSRTPQTKDGTTVDWAP